MSSVEITTSGKLIDLLSPKRIATDSEDDLWYPYYAGYSLRFARTAMEQARVPKGSVVLDPWVGGGTTIGAAVLNGNDVLGVDLNPFAVVIASARLADERSLSELDSRVEELLEGVEKVSPTLDDVLVEWVSPRAAARIRTVVERILRLYSVPDGWVEIRPDAAFLLLCVVRAAKDTVAPRTRTNPTWPVRGEKPRLRLSEFLGRFRFWVQHLASAGRRRSCEGTRQRVLVGDSRALPLADRSVRFVLGSPPYCTRIDYAASLRFELAVIGREGVFGEFRKRLMGTTTIRQSSLGLPDDWPSSVRNLLVAVREHKSHRSSGYYYRNLLQYFHDANASVNELSRVIERGGEANLVLQTSYYKEVEIALPALFCALGESHGLVCDEIARIPVRRVLTSMNSKSRRYLEKRAYFESVIRMRQPG